MPKVDWITWKTDVNEIINPQTVIDEVSEKFQDYTVYTNSIIYEGINHEISNGGLDKESLNINGTSLANEKALKILDNLDEIKRMMQDLKKKIQESTEEQKQIEKEQLIQAIQIKIEEEEKIKNNTVYLNEKLQGENELINKNSVEDIIDDTNERINQLKEKLEAAQAL